jgi:hypothetical protein
MKPLPNAELKKIADTHKIKYSPINAKLRRKIGTRITRVFNTPRAKLYKLLADPLAHQNLFAQFKRIQPIDTSKFKPLIGRNEIISLEWVDEGGPKLAIARTLLQPPGKIVKEVLSGPFTELGGIHIQDKKKGIIIWSIDEVSPRSCKLVAESEFDVAAKSVFVRSLIDTIWIDSFERIMIAMGELTTKQKLIQGE